MKFTSTSSFLAFSLIFSSLSFANSKIIQECNLESSSNQLEKIEFIKTRGDITCKILNKDKAEFIGQADAGLIDKDNLSSEMDYGMHFLAISMGMTNYKKADYFICNLDNSSTNDKDEEESLVLIKAQDEDGKFIGKKALLPDDSVFDCI